MNIMRTTTLLHKTAMAVAQGLLLTLALSACSDEDTVSADDIEHAEGEEYVADPTDDQMEVTYSGKTAVIDYNFDDMGLAIFSRLSNKTGELDDDVDAVLLSPSTLNGDFAINEAAQLVKLYEKGAAIILVEPRDENWDKLGVLLKKAEKVMVADSTDTYIVHRLVDSWEMLQQQGREASAFGKQDAVALRLDDTYIICDLQEQADSCLLAAGEATQEVTDYRYGKSADLLVEWLNKKEENKAQLKEGKAKAATFMRASSSGATALENIARAKKTTVQKSVGPSRIFGRTMPYEFQYEIYSLYNITSDEEYYLIRQHIDYHCSQLRCTKNDKEEWTAIPESKTFYLDDGTKVDKDWSSHLWIPYSSTYKAFGPYMRKSIVSSEITNLAGSETVHLMDPKPGTSQGSQTQTSGFSFSISPGFLIGMNFENTWDTDLDDDFGWSSMITPRLTLQSGVTKSSSYSVSLNDLTYTQKYTNTMASWTMEGVKSHIHDHNNTFWVVKGWHDVIGDFQRADWDTDLTWYYRIEHPDKKRTYKLRITDKTEIAELLFSHYDYELAVHPVQSHDIELPTPSRYMQEWVMSCSDEKLLDNIRNIYDDWQDQFYTAAQTEEGVDENMVITFKYIKKVIKGIAPKLVEQGYTGNYTFRVRRKGSTTDFLTFTMKNGVVE